ncbi:MAG: acyl-CoA thioesterase [Clostridiales Family XIII bacterium]|jgi:acyl-CoA hydrolase|nr:acyl-CoA thioesterase [Clostridiales Family XIII bacterium]
MSKASGINIGSNELAFATVMQPNQANQFGNIHGGEIMKLMDNVAGALAHRYAKSNVVTARVEEIQFLNPIMVGAYVFCKGKIAYVGNTSMEIFITVDVVQDLSDFEDSERALEAFFTMVSLDVTGRPHKVPAYEPATDEEKELYKIAERRRENARKARHRR